MLRLELKKTTEKSGSRTILRNIISLQYVFQSPECTIQSCTNRATDLG